MDVKKEIDWMRVLMFTAFTFGVTIILTSTPLVPEGFHPLVAALTAAVSVLTGLFTNPHKSVSPPPHSLDT